MDERVEITISIESRKLRLEDFLLDHFPRLSKMYLKDVVKSGFCQVNGRLANIGYRLRENDFIEIVLDEARETAMLPENIPLDIVFEDNDLIVVNKPAGMLVHPSHRENNGTMLNALSYYLNNKIGLGDRLNGSKPGLIRPGLPHRLDKDTSGLIVVAKSPVAHRKLSRSFLRKEVEKRYLAVVEGTVDRESGVITAPIGRFADEKMWGVKEGGKDAETRFWVRDSRNGSTLIELEPVTGRTNQLRIHCEMIGHPIVGDVQRGGREFVRLCLHAFSLRFPHPVSREAMVFEAEMPAEFVLD